MTYNVHQPWDPLKLCIVGRSYNPEFYKFIPNVKTRTVLERIAEQTEADYQKLIKVLESFGVEVLRPTVSDDFNNYINSNGKLAPPPMTPRDYISMIGSDLYIETNQILVSWNYLKGEHWPAQPHSPKELTESVIKECAEFNVFDLHDKLNDYQHILDRVAGNVSSIRQNVDKHLNSAMITRVGYDLYFGTESANDDMTALQLKYSNLFPDYRCHVIPTCGHADSTFCVVKPGLIISSHDITDYSQTFPGWEVVYLPRQDWSLMKSFEALKIHNNGKWWVPGEESNDEFTTYVETWFNNWTGYVEETLFDVNMLVIDESNIICSAYNDEMFKALERHGVTPHVVDFQHKLFWDGGIHCITSDLHREGQLINYFPNRS